MQYNNILSDWKVVLDNEFKKEYYKNLYKFINEEYKNNIIFPYKDEIFNALYYTQLNNVKVVILGQDPYHGFNQAHGLSFSVKYGCKIPKSLKNIYKELNKFNGCFQPNNGCLIKWAKQGVLLLNTILTVRAHKPNSHAGYGWEKFTDSIIKKINEQDRYIVYMLWGNSAKIKSIMITNSKHLVLKAAHPSPLSANRGFFGCDHFNKANKFLKAHGIDPIDWQIENI